jgi:CRP/FNR family cyclic AMP-dependent transcriptional regulator
MTIRPDAPGNDGADRMQAPVSSAELAEIGLFGALDAPMLEHLASTLRLATPDAGDVVFREGDKGSEMYVVLHGEFEVLKRSKQGIDARVAMLGTGDWFGEMSILDVHNRSATVRALSPSRLLVISASDLDAMYRRDVRSYALLVLNIARELSRRLRVADGILADLVANLLGDLVANRHGSAT